MNLNEIVRGALRWLMYVLLHIFVARHLVLFDYAFCFIYVGAILFLPQEINLTGLLLIGFATGVTIDSFDNTLGLHAATSVVVAYLRPTVIRYQFAQKISEGRMELSLKELGLPAFLSYTLILVSIHHILLFFVEAGGLGLLSYTLLKIACSILFTTVTVLLAQLFSR
ncbi:hypothetical protein [Runella slithyformis]|uniref:Rod shape-determining protein MreD n=1 Tax=Runella slithyformis (strain ATCC 29530 / DSM 19594 / LMG 11500 / NCIMB 11436 / LSU 4) TaxID=761193 RepID=A0A7U3ZHS8_RUNSL|nr:hypothetical protein [Runella slithyformis]AEI47460.1 hypothetical protein Runsl_1029 [Runella slithyformis DSM 19594]